MGKQIEQVKKPIEEKKEDERRVIETGMKIYNKKFISEFFNFYEAVNEKNPGLFPINPIEKNRILNEPMTKKKMEFFIELVKRLQKTLGVEDDGLWGAKSEKAARRYAKKNEIKIKVPKSVTSKEKYIIEDKGIGEYSKKEGIEITGAEIKNDRYNANQIDIEEPVYYTRITCYFDSKDKKNQFLRFDIPYLKNKEGKIRGILFNFTEYSIEKFNKVTGLNLTISDENNGIYISDEALEEILSARRFISKYYMDYKGERNFRPKLTDIFHFIAGVHRFEEIGYTREEAAKMLVRLQRRFGITHFARYGAKQLEEQYKLVDWDTGKLKIKGDEKIVISFAAYHDYNGVFMNIGEEIVAPVKKYGYLPIIYEGNNEAQLKNAIEDVNNYKYTLIMSAHGSRVDMQLGDGPNEEERISFDDTNLFEEMKGVYEIILFSCSTSEIVETGDERKWTMDNIAHKMLEKTEAIAIYAPPAPAYKMVLLKGKNNELVPVFLVENPDKSNKKPISLIARIDKEGETLYLLEVVQNEQNPDEKTIKIKNKLQIKTANKKDEK